MQEKQKKPLNGAKNTGAVMLGNFLPGIMGGEDPSLGNFEPPKEQKGKEPPTD